MIIHFLSLEVKSFAKWNRKQETLRVKKENQSFLNFCGSPMGLRVIIMFTTPYLTFWHM